VNPGTRLHLPAGTTRDGGFELVVTPESAGWTWSSLRVLELRAAADYQLSTGPEEMVVLPLEGACEVTADGSSHVLSGRSDVFHGVSDMLYLPRDCDATIRSGDGGRVALPGARCDRRLGVRYRSAQDVPVEIRGAGNCSRQVNNFCSADSFEADRLIAVEVLTPSGNWSSYPPHKHDDDRPGEESVLEEIYYFEVADGPNAAGVGYHRVYGTANRPIDIAAEVRTGDVILVPHGWHGPSMAAPGYDLYYLNVMAGPSEQRAWLICDDPDHAWVRDTWAGQQPDPRLPMTGVQESPGGSS
jgi:5-deoxy-glucuronate isomerase